MEKIDRIALIAGNGKFPLFLAKAARVSGVNVMAIAITSETDKDIEKVADKVYWLKLGEAGKVIDVLRREQIKYAVMAGKITKTTIIKESLSFDEEAKKLLGRVINRSDDTLLSAVANRLKDFDIELIDSTTFVKGMMPSKGVLTIKKPTAEELEDIKFGFNIAKEIGRLDIGQAIAIKAKAVIAIEAIEGTDEMVRRAGALAGKGAVIIKVSKPNQDMRFDVPVVGLKTIEVLSAAGVSVLALEADNVLMLEKEEVIREADKLGLSIIAV